jgi:hypothetical protein
MNRTSLAAVVTSLLAGVAPPFTGATPSEAPVFAVGLLGSYSELEFKGRSSTSTEHIPQAGAFLNFGNKMTGRGGLVYQAEITGQYSEEKHQRVTDGQADLDLGWRMALDADNFLDVLIGGGYKWNRYDPDFNKYDINLTNRTPFAKVAAGYNHAFSTSTLRLEAGVRKVINGDAQLQIHGVSSQELDLEDTTNPFVELNWLFNQQGAIAFIAGLYYNRFEYDLDGQFQFTDFDKQTREEYGAKIGIVF